MNKKILFRADGNTEIGFGHLYRLLAFFEKVKDEFETHFVTHESSRVDILDGVQLTVIPDDQVEIDFLVSNFSPDEYIIVLDGYEFNPAYQRSLKAIGYKLIYVDDLNAFNQVADVIINHAAGATKEMYKESQSKLGLGLDYMLIRDNFILAASTIREPRPLENVFVCFGGADPYGLTKKVLDAILEVEFIREIYVVGDYEVADDERVKVKKGLNQDQMLDLMSKSDMGFAPSSTISYELCCAQVPIVCGYYTDNQKMIYEGLKSEKVISPIEDYRNCTKGDLLARLDTLVSIESRGQLMEKQRSVFQRPVSENLKKVLANLC
jgi:UDP-2,4-diacetamido-2,4,6-trideoxy-beta-L-altropyranose hydrolase